MQMSYNGSEGESNLQTGQQPFSLLHVITYFGSWSNILKLALLWLDIRERRIHNTELQVKNMITSTISSKVNSLLPSLNLNRSPWIALPRKKHDSHTIEARVKAVCKLTSIPLPCSISCPISVPSPIFCEFPPLWLEISVGRILYTGIRGRKMLTSNMSSRVNVVLPSLNLAIVGGQLQCKKHESHSMEARVRTIRKRTNNPLFSSISSPTSILLPLMFGSCIFSDRYKSGYK